MNDLPTPTPAGERARTRRAAGLALLIGLLFIGGLLAFMGVPAPIAFGIGLFMGLAFAGLLLAASKRAATFDPTPMATREQATRAMTDPGTTNHPEDHA